jgi:S-adenosylmethionine decarboxylase
MFYEGSEKRLEITSSLNLLEFEHDFWPTMVEHADAYVISHIENNELKAFLLSESSLFVWKHRLLLITCGETNLVHASLYFQKMVKREQITSLLFQRHQAHHPERQKSSFQQDSLKLQQELKGDSHHWSEGYCGDIFLFGNNQQSNATKNILMLHDLDSEFFTELQEEKIEETIVASKLKLLQHFKHFSIDQHSFEPKGYSLNAIDAERYFTIHITPEKLSSYISFESNLPIQEIVNFQQHLLSLFNPERAYLMSFNRTNEKINIKTIEINSHKNKKSHSISK